ncbi:MAG: TOBE domain-containing protein, partial [Halomonas aquamarina]
GSPTMNFMPAELLGGNEEGCRVQAPGLGELSLPQDASGQGPGAELSLGVRPEHLRLAEAEGDNRFEIVNVEYLGNEVYVYLEPREGDTLLIHRSEAPSDWQVGQDVALRVDVEHTHLFDASDRALAIATQRHAA